jgi:RNA polymerase sigma factor (sigma-70 family)
VTNATAVPLALVAHAANRRLIPGAATGAAEDLADSEAFGRTLQREAPVLLAAARALVLDDAEAADLVQATFELAVKHRSSLREAGALRSWLLTIQTREAFRVRRRLARLVRFDGVVDLTASPPTDPEWIAVRDALGKLSPRVRAAVVLHHMAGLPVGDVAAALGTSPNTVKTQLRRGLARLRKDLGDD